MDFRFEDLEVWKDAVDLSCELFKAAQKAEDRKKFRFAEQLYGAAMSITNNIAEGSGSNWDKEFAQYLNIARRSVFECANILYLYEKTEIINDEFRKELYNKLLVLSRKLYFMRQSLLSKRSW